MIPLGDADRRPGPPPTVTAFLVAANIIVFLLELAGGEPLILRWSVVPARLAAGQGLITPLSAMFLHGSWMHIAGNMIFLWPFGRGVEQTMGKARYLGFYLSGGLVAFIAQVAIDPASTVPTLGASGAIAAVMGAFLVEHPRDRIRTLLLLGWFVTITLIPAVVLIGLWFLLQLLNEVGSLVEHQSGGVAYVAHIAGLLYGVVISRVLAPATRGER